MSRNEINESNKADIPLKSGTLIRGIGSFYTVRDSDHQEYTLRCKKKFRRDGISPLVGDEVLFSPGQGEEHGWLEEILPRKTECPINGHYPNEDIATAIVFNVVGKCTDRAVDGSRIPAFLELNAVGLDPAFVEQIIDVG